MSRLMGVTVWLLIGATLAGGAYWGFLNTPESSVPALLLSAFLALVTLVLVAITVNGASLLWSRGWAAGVVGPAIGKVPAFLVAAIVTGGLYWLVGRGTAWVEQNSGEINAWFIAQFGWADASAVFRTATWGGRWLQWVIAPLLGLSLLGSMVSGEWSSTRGRWLRRSLSPLRIVMATVWVGVFIVLPWIYLVPWRPKGLPPTSTELAFVIAKLGTVAVLAAIGVALVTKAAMPPPAPPATARAS